MNLYRKQRNKTSTRRDRTLKLWISKLQRMHFGCKSEKLDTQIAQPELRLEDLQADKNQSASTAQQQKRPFHTPHRKPLPPHLPREERVHSPTEQAGPSCGSQPKHLGEDVSEQFE